MPRSSQLLYPARPPAEPQAAACLLLLRDGPKGLQVLLTQRSAQARFAPGAYVFPGGCVDADDARLPAATRPRQRGHALTAALAALRETFEEMGVLLARRPDGLPAIAQDVAGLERHAPLAPQCQARGLKLAACELFLLARWITGCDWPRRYDVPHFVARMPSGQRPQADGQEQLNAQWLTASAALARRAAGRLPLMFPTLKTLEWLRSQPNVAAVLAACAGEAPLWTSCPRAARRQGRIARFMEHELPFGELALVCPDGQGEHEIGWQHEKPVPLLRNVRRLTAANSGFMTGPGTNSYLVGDAAAGFIVIDPGPADEAHVQRLWQAAGGQVRAIICTHSHPDHAPGGWLLQAMCSKRVPVLGLPSSPQGRPDSAFTPDRALYDGERLQLAGEQTHTLRVIHTPGHTANHLCLVLEEDGLLFSGDHILSGSTTVIDAPDGDMTVYLASLDKLAAACAAYGANFILPAHGHVLHEAQQAIVRLKAHRLAREAKVLAAMRQRPSGTLDDWLPLAYADVPPEAHAAARKSLHAHVQRIRQLDLLREDGASAWRQAA